MQYWIYKWRYIKRKLWNFFGYCHKCGHALDYTPNGRGVCTNGDCR